MKETIEAKLHNRFDIEVRDAKTGELKQRAYAENIILNQAWALILQQRENAIKWFNKIGYGTGTGTIVATRTALFAPLSTKVAIDAISSYNKTNNYYSLRQKIVLIETEHIGSTLTEVGIVDNTTLCTHAQLRDMNGNPVSILKTSTDIITIFATVYLMIQNAYAKDAKVDFYRCIAEYNSLVLGLLGKSTLAPYAQYDNYNSSYKVLLPVYYRVFNRNQLSSPAGTTNNGAITITFDVPNKNATMYFRVPAANENLGGIKTIILDTYGSYSGWGNNLPAIRVHFPSSSHTQSLIVEQIGTGNDVLTDFATAFPFVKTGAVIKVDGVVVSPTVILGVPKIKNIWLYFYNLGIDGDGYLSYSTNVNSESANTSRIVENPVYNTHDIDSVVCSTCKIETSDDLVTWTQVYSGTGTYSVATEQKRKRYWKLSPSGAVGTTWSVTEINANALDNFKNVRFASAPATGAVITAEYDTDVAAKDVNHVLDITVVLQLGEYTP